MTADHETLQGGRYVVLGALGEGAQGRTFDGVDKREGRPVAIKRFDVRGARAWKDVELAEREARVLRSLSHPRLPRYVDHFEQGGALYLVMEKIDGESLARMRQRGAALDEKDVWRLLRDASEVLDYLHGRAPPVIHRDLKPGNVIRRPDGSFAFVDFGAVRDKLRPEGGSTVVGTFGYMAPEQFQGRALPASDVYAVGATAVALLTGTEPENLPHKGLALDVRAALRGRASERLTATLERMLDPDPDTRAGRIAPLLADESRRSDRGSRQAAGDDRTTRRFEQKGRDTADRYRDEMSAHDERRRRRRLRREARRLERDARRGARASRPLPFPFSLFFTLLFAIGILAVSVATQVVVPLVLSVLSLFIARRALHEAARTVRAAGHAAVDGMRRTRGWLYGQGAAVGGDANTSASRPAEDPRVRVERAPSSGRARVADEVPADEQDESDEEERQRHHL